MNNKEGNAPRAVIKSETPAPPPPPPPPSKVTISFRPPYGQHIGTEAEVVIGSSTD